MDTLASALAQYGEAQTGPNRLSMVDLALTEVVRQAAGASPNDTFLAKRLSLCEERDAIQADRPDGCWCLGLGWPMREEIHWRYDELATSSFCPCPEGIAGRLEYEAEQEREAQERRRLRVEHIWDETAEIPNLFREWRLDSSPLQPVYVDPLRCPGDEDARDVWSKSSWYLWGPYGCGKTGLVVGHAYERLITDASTILFRSVPDLLTELRSTYNRSDGPSEYAVLEKYAGVSLLILDDLGAEHISGSGWLEDRLYQIIGQRHRDERPIVFTSNLSIKEVGGRIGERIAWRIVEMCGDNIVHVQGANQRDRRR
ncbi:MAG: ATP-binding protein [Chloroflexi bacterium]|nr:ATP-binding protein [Chloroflexota bacterium]